MRKSGKLVAVMVLSSFVPVGGAWAAPAPGLPAAGPAVSAAVVDVRDLASAPAPSEGLRQSLAAPRVTPPSAPRRLETAVASAFEQGQSSSGKHGLGNGAKAVIWVTAVTVAGVWGWKTFSVTRGTD